MSHNRILISFFLLNTIAFSQEDVPFDISKQFAVPTDNNQLIWNDDSYFDILLRILRELFFVLSPATVYVINAGLFSFLQFSKAIEIFDFIFK